MLEGGSFEYGGARFRYTFADVWYAMMHERYFNYAFWINVSLDILQDYALRCMGYLMVTAALILITFISSIGFCIVLPTVAEFNTPWYWFNVIWGKTEHSYFELRV